MDNKRPEEHRREELRNIFIKHVAKISEAHIRLSRPEDYPAFADVVFNVFFELFDDTLEITKKNDQTLLQ